MRYPIACAPDPRIPLIRTTDQCAPYRPDIDGLRAVAVLAVILYHAFPQIVRGGFVGVDVFFVISGFLITGIVVDEIDAGRFGFAAFYARRVRRLAPALLLVLAACLTYGFVVLLPVEMKSLGQQVCAAVLFLSNVLLWREAGYFDGAAATKPLLHLWSLGVEEQFYLIWPLALWSLWRWRAGRAQFIVAITTTSFVVSAVLSAADPVVDFYSPFSRFWELGCGALLASRAKLPPRASAGAAWLGLCLVLAAVFSFNAATPFPGWRALLPVAGAALLLAAGPAASVNRAILSCRPAVFLGRISYPLYLWHWPLLSFATILRIGRHPTPLMAAGLLTASFMLAWLTARFVEAPLRFGSGSPRATRPLVGFMAALGMAGAACWLTHGFAARFGGLPRIDIARINAAVGDGIFQSTPGMSVTRTGLVTVSSITASAPDAAGDAVLLTGDSLIYQYAPRVEALYRARRLRRSVIFVAGPSCSPVPGVLRFGSFAGCDAMPRVIADTVAGRHVGTVVMGAFWSGFGGGGLLVARGGVDMPLNTAAAESMMYANLQEDVAGLIAGGHRVVLLLSSPVSARFDPRHMIDRSLSGFAVDPEALLPVAVAGLHDNTADADRRLMAVARATGAATISPYPDVCGVGPGCSPFFDDAEPKFADAKHLRPIFVATRIHFLDDILTGR